MYRFVLFTHIIAAMVFFGLPFAFGRWFGACSPSESTLAACLQQIRRLALVHLNLAAVFSLFTGLWLAHHLDAWRMGIWPELSLVLLALSLLNVNLTLGRTSADQEARRIRRRIAIFSALHHTLVTALAGLMVFKP